MSNRRAALFGVVIVAVGIVALFVPGPGNRNAVFGVTTLAIGVLTLLMAAISAARGRKGPRT